MDITEALNEFENCGKELNHREDVLEQIRTKLMNEHNKNENEMEQLRENSEQCRSLSSTNLVYYARLFGCIKRRENLREQVKEVVKLYRQNLAALEQYYQLADKYKSFGGNKND